MLTRIEVFSQLWEGLGRLKNPGAACQVANKARQQLRVLWIEHTKHQAQRSTRDPGDLTLDRGISQSKFPSKPEDKSSPVGGIQARSEITAEDEHMVKYGTSAPEKSTPEFEEDTSHKDPGAFTKDLSILSLGDAHAELPMLAEDVR